MEVLYPELENDIEDKDLLVDDFKASSLLKSQISRNQVKQEIQLVSKSKTKNKLEQIILIIAIMLIGFGALIMLFAVGHSQTNTHKSYYFLDVLGK